MDVFALVPYLHVMDDILVAAVVIAMFFYTAYPEVKRVACRVRVRANDGAKHYRGQTPL